MTVSELIQELQNYPMDMEVECVSESSEWAWNGENSVEVTTTEDGPITKVERWTDKYGIDVVRIS